MPRSFNIDEKQQKELKAFLSEVELSARRVLRDDNKKRRDQAILSQKKAIIEKCKNNTSDNKVNLNTTSSLNRSKKQRCRSFFPNVNKFPSKSAPSYALQTKQITKYPRKSTNFSHIIHQSLMESPLHKNVTESQQKFSASTATLSHPSTRSPIQRSCALSNPHSVPRIKSKHTQKRKVEGRGPIDWTLEELRKKYRCTFRRFQRFQEYLQALEESKKIEEHYGEVEDVEKVEKHPILNLLDTMIEKENMKVQISSRKAYRQRAKFSDLRMRLRIDLKQLQASQEKQATADTMLSLSDTPEPAKSITSKLVTQIILPPEESIITKNFKVPQEQWLLMKNEPILNSANNFESQLLISIVRYCSHDSATESYWSIKLFDTFNGDEKTEIISEILVQEKLKNASSIHENDNADIEDCVHEQESIMMIHNSEIPIKTFVKVRRKSFGIAAIIQIFPIKNMKICGVNIHEGVPFSNELNIPVCEVLSRLKMHFVYSAFSISFWRSKCNGSSVWSPLLHKLRLKKNTKQQNQVMQLNRESDIKHKDMHHFHLGFDESTMKKDSIDWNLPVMKDTEKYISMVNLAYTYVEEMLSVCERTENDKAKEFMSYLAKSRASFAFKKNSCMKWKNDSINDHPLSIRLVKEKLLTSGTIAPGCTITSTKDLWTNSFRQSCISEGECLQHDKSVVVSCLERSDGNILIKSFLAIDSPVLSTLQIAMDTEVNVPPKTPIGGFKSVMPTDKADCTIHINNPLKSDVDERLPPTILILDPAECEKDWEGYYKDFESTSNHENILMVKHRREMNEISEFSFRTKVFGHFIDYDSKVPNHVYGITEKGVTPNQTNVHDPNISRSKSVCAKMNLTRQRTAKDFKNIIQNIHADKDGGRQNDACIFTVQMDTYSMAYVSRQTYNEYKCERERELYERAIKSRERELQEKIQKATLIVEKRERTKKKEIQEEVLKASGFKVNKTCHNASNEQQNLTSIPTKQVTNNKNSEKNNNEKAMINMSENRYGTKCESEHSNDVKQTKIDSETFENFEIENNNIDESKEKMKSPCDGEDFRRDTSNVADLAAALSQNDQFMNALASKLGLTSDQIEKLHLTKEPSISSKTTNALERKHSNATTESDSETSITSSNNNKDNVPATNIESTSPHQIQERNFPQNHADLFLEHHEKRENGILLEKQSGDKLTIKSKTKHTSIVARHYGWRKKPTASIGADFFKLNKHKIEKCHGKMFNTTSNTKIVGMVNPSKDSAFKVDESQFKMKMNTLFIDNVLNDIDRKSHLKEMQKKRDELLLTASDSSALKGILNEQPFEYTSVAGMVPNETTIYEMKMGEQKQVQEKRADDLVTKAFVSVKNANYNKLEALFDEGIDVDMKDEHGNTLLILSCQQGNKKMAKFLLRRGATMNAQNNSGNTCLHYLYEYGHDALADYLIRKGADDTFLNFDGLTCYEGVNKANIKDL